MSRALIQTANQSPQTVAVNGIISPGAVQRRFGCGIRLSGNAIEVNEPGYFLISASVTATPTAAEDVTVVVYENGTPLPGAIATSTVGEAGNSTNLSIVSTIRKGCCGDNLLSTLTFVLTSGAGVIDNISVRIEKA